MRLCLLGRSDTHHSIQVVALTTFLTAEHFELAPALAQAPLKLALM